MEIVIKISEEDYKWFKKFHEKDYYDDRFNHAYTAIANGTPLPINHGRLIDESKITSCEWTGKEMICNAPTIVDADT